MLGFVKGLIKASLPMGLYLATLGACFAAVAGYPIFALATLSVATPLPNVWYQIHEFPMGKDVLDLLVASSLIGMVVGRHVKVRSRSGILLVLYMLITYLAVWNSSQRYGLPAPITPANAVFVHWKNYAEMILLYFIAFHVLPDEKRQKQLVMLCMFVLFLIAFREARNFTESMGGFSYDKRAGGPFWAAGLGANSFGAFIVHFGAIALALGFYLKDKRERWFLLLTAIMCVKPLFFSYSRGAYLAALAVLLIFGVLKKRSLLVLLALVFISWQTLLPETVVERITMTETPQGELESSAADRIELWDAAVNLFKQNSVFGVGLSGFGLSGVGGKYTSVHSLYLETLAEQGVFGFAFLAVVLLSALLAGVRLLLRANTPFQKGLGLGFVGCVVALIITNMFGDRWSFFATGAYFWIMWGVVDRALVNLAAEARMVTSAQRAPETGSERQQTAVGPPSASPTPAVTYLTRAVLRDQSRLDPAAPVRQPPPE